MLLEKDSAYQNHPHSHGAILQPLINLVKITATMLSLAMMVLNTHKPSNIYT
tara:strand:+ start:346 stop:501 length:156 start_codon:yes stop_codon:yes gene_type:complete